MRIRLITVVTLIIVLIAGWRFIPVPGTYHFAGAGENFSAGVTV